MAGTPGTPTCSARPPTGLSARTLRLDGTQDTLNRPEQRTGVPTNQTQWDDLDQRRHAGNSGLASMEDSSCAESRSAVSGHNTSTEPANPSAARSTAVIPAIATPTTSRAAG